MLAKGSHRHDKDEKRPWWGGWGHFSPGIFVGHFGDVGERLDDGDSFSDEIRYRPIGLMLGGGGRALLAGRFLIGGKGFAMLPQSQVTERGRAVLTGGGGGLDVGLLIYNRRHWLMYPYVGFGGFGYSLDLRNQSEQDVVVSPNITLEPEAGFATAEIGFGFARTAFWGQGGFMHGIEIGMMFALSEDRWKTEDDVSVALPPANMLGGYLRMNIGGGGFWYRKSDM